MWHEFEYESSIDGNWVADLDGRFEVLWDEDFADWGLGSVEFRHLKYDSTKGSDGLREWYAEASANDPLAKAILPEIRLFITWCYDGEVKARAAEAREDQAGEIADQRRGFYDG